MDNPPGNAQDDAVVSTAPDPTVHQAQTPDPSAASTGMHLTAAAFRRSVLRPAEGVFLFHPRALERLQRGPGEERPQPRPRRDCCYYLLARASFLTRLEPENPEALSVIEGLPLPDWILLLPMPATAVFKTTPGRTLLRDYWARRFEGEVARAWQTARDDNQDLTTFGPAALRALIGASALAEAREVLLREGVTGAAEGDTALCRAFVARTTRLRYFAPGLRACYFPAVTRWDTVDRWLEDSGLDLPARQPRGRLPQTLERSRPAADCGQPGVHLPLPDDLPCGGPDPDRPAVNLTATPPAPGLQYPPSATPAAAHPQTDLQTRCLQARVQGALIHRRATLGARLSRGVTKLLRSGLARTSGQGAIVDRGAQGVITRGRLHRLCRCSARAQRAEWEGRFAVALRHLHAAGLCYARLRGEPAHDATDDPVTEMLARRRAAVIDSFADQLAVSARLGLAAAADLTELIRRLTVQSGTTAIRAQSILERLETALLEERKTYYRFEPGGWLTGGQLRRVLPFQGTLEGLAALQGACRLFNELPWPVADLDHLGAPLAALTRQRGAGLDERLRPQLARVIQTAGLVPSSATEGLAARRLTDALAGLIRRRRHLKFADVRDLLNQDVLSLPDTGLSELHAGDRLHRFDRAAARALPGVYQPGEFYVKGLQRLGAPLFGTPGGRRLLRFILLPGLAAWATIEIGHLLWGLLGGTLQGNGWSGLTVLILLGAVISTIANTARGRTAAYLAWRTAADLLHLLFVTGVPFLLHSRPMVWLRRQPLVRALIDRLLAPLILGLLPLLPVAILWSAGMPQGPGLIDSVPVLVLALAFGTLLRETAGGRRRLDDLTTGWRGLLDLVRRERLAGLVAPVMEFFKRATRGLTEGLFHIRYRLSPRLGEPAHRALLKAMAAPPWALCEAVIEFYVVVLIEPQTNPIKHFPVVTLGHKLMLPLLPALSSTLYTAAAPILPDALTLPLIAATIFLLPGLFGFLFWELKENWRLYAANRRDPVPVARLGDHGETMIRMLSRGLHGGSLPRAFDRLRQVLDRQAREERPDEHELRRVLTRIGEYRALLGRFGASELAVPLAAACRTDTEDTDAPAGADCVRLAPPRIGTQSVSYHAEVCPTAASSPLTLTLELTSTESGLACTLVHAGPWDELSEACRARLDSAVQWFRRRCGAGVSAG
jgi:hypothetical protein